MDEELRLKMQYKLLQWAIKRLELSSQIEAFLREYEDHKTRLAPSALLLELWNFESLKAAQKKLVQDFSQKARGLVNIDMELVTEMQLDLNETLLFLSGVHLGQSYNRPSVDAFLSWCHRSRERLTTVLSTIDELNGAHMPDDICDELKKQSEELLENVPESIVSSGIEESRRKLEELKLQQVAYRQEISRKMREEEEQLIIERNRAEAAMREAIEEEGRMLQKRMMDEKMEREHKERERYKVEEEQRRIEEVDEKERKAKYERDLIELERRREQQLADIEEQARRERARRDQERAMRERGLGEKMERDRSELERLNEEMKALKRGEVLNAQSLDASSEQERRGTNHNVVPSNPIENGPIVAGNDPNGNAPLWNLLIFVLYLAIKPVELILAFVQNWRHH